MQTIDQITSVQLFKLPFVRADLEAFSNLLIKKAIQKKKTTVYPTTMNEISEAYKNNEIYHKLSQFSFLTMDGMPLVWLCRLKGGGNAQRIYGPDLLLEVCKQSQKKTIRHFFFGTTPQTLKKLIDRLGITCPQLTIAGSCAPPFRKLKPTESKTLLSMINRSQADILWVGLGSTKQLAWIIDNRNSLNSSVIIAVGAAFDFLSGQKKQAPYWIRSIGLEWMFRLFQEPTRLWPRYIKKFPLITFLLLKEFFNHSKK